MSYVDPKIMSHFQTMPPELQSAVLARNVTLHSLQDLIAVLEQIVSEG
ncbi:hypothetical protein [Acidaminobacterium chupaoyuni]